MQSEKALRKLVPRMRHHKASQKIAWDAHHKDHGASDGAHTTHLTLGNRLKTHSAHTNPLRRVCG